MMASRDIGGKELELLKEVVPKATRAAYLFDSANPGSLLAQKELEAAGRALGVGLRLTGVRSENDLEAAFAAITRERVGAVLVAAGPFETINRRRIIDLAAASRLPAMYGAKWFVDDGGLISYGVSVPDNFRRVATYVDKILKGAARGPPRRATDKVRAGDQPQDREGPRPDDPTVAAGAGR